MGYGDEVMATGLAKGLANRGKLAAFGDGKRIVWGPWSSEVFKFNPNIAFQGNEGSPNLEWIPHYKGHRLYNRLHVNGRQWVWNYKFKPIPGEMFFSDEEKEDAKRAGQDFILIEPNLPWQKSVAVNKDWGFNNYYEVSSQLLDDGHDVVQFENGRNHLAGVRLIRSRGYRDALAIIARAKLVICPEGGLHHGAAAVETKAVVLFGGFIPPQVTGYDSHINLTGNSTQACGSLHRCEHCIQAMASIKPEEVYDAATKI